jgi:protein ImuA
MIKSDVRHLLDQMNLFSRLEQTMNIIDSDGTKALSPSPITSIAVPPQAQSKPATAKSSALRTRLAALLKSSGVKTEEHLDEPTHFTFGVAALDKALRGNALADGLPRAALHEIHSAAKADITSAAAMAVLLSLRFGDDKPILWIRESGDAHRQGQLYPPGLIELGIDPARIIHVDAPNSIAVLRAAADGVRCAGMGVVIAELSGKKPKGLDLTATRRLSLSAQKSNVPTLLLRSGTSPEDPLPTSAFSRWQVSAAPSVPLEGNASGHPVFDLTLLRHRSGLYGLAARLEWNRDRKKFRDIAAAQSSDKDAPDLSAVSPLSAIRTSHQATRAA